MEVLAFSLSLSNLGSILLAAFGLGLVIFIHELGHFAVAKWCGVKVEKFSIGFGPALWSHKRGETEYVFAALPLGGFVKMLGQDDADPGQMTDQQVAQDPRSYPAKSVPQRIAIISAGVINNMVSAVLFFIIAFLLGVKYQPAVIGSVTPGMPAWQADLRTGDQILRVDDREDQQLSFTDVRLAVALSKEHQELEVSGLRNGKPFTTRLRPVVMEGMLVPQIFAEPMQSLTLPDVSSEDEKIYLTRPGLSASRAEPPFEPADTIVELDGKPLTDYAALARELATHRAETVKFGVRRKGVAKDGPITVITVEPNHFRTLGLSMAIGKITAVRDDSPAARESIVPGDTITHVQESNEWKAVGVDIDPLELPDFFNDRAGHPVMVRMKHEVTGGSATTRDVSITPEERSAWTERPNAMLKDCPLSIPAIGVAVHVLHTVTAIDEKGPAYLAGIRKGDSLEKMRFAPPADLVARQKGAELKDFVIRFDKDERNWPGAFWQLQDFPQWQVFMTVKSPTTEKSVEYEVVPQAAPDWYLPIRGLAMQSQSGTRRAANIGEAASLGFRRTRDSIIEMWFTIHGLFSRRISPKALGGPIRIAETAFFFSQQGVPDLILFLGILSVSLAVLNFLPIPVLDGGHFIFLCWEGIRGKPPSPRVVIAATYVGLAFILSLMAFVMYIDISSHFIKN